MTTTTPTPEPMPELKPCPFCGGKPMRVENYSRTQQAIFCTNKKCAAEILHPHHWDIVTAWNQRADLSRPAVGDVNHEQREYLYEMVLRGPNNPSYAEIMASQADLVAGSMMAPQPPAEDLRKVREALENAQATMKYYGHTPLIKVDEALAIMKKLGA